MTRAVVVDDDALVLSMMRRTLQLYGFNVECHNGSAAFFWHLDARSPPAVVFCDVMMPLEDGVQLYRKLLAVLGDRMPDFIFMTAMEPSHELHALLRENPSLKLLRKPFSLQELRQTIPPSTSVARIETADSGFAPA